MEYKSNTFTAALPYDKNFEIRTIFAFIITLICCFNGLSLHAEYSSVEASNAYFIFTNFKVAPSKNAVWVDMCDVSPYAPVDDSRKRNNTPVYVTLADGTQFTMYPRGGNLVIDLTPALRKALVSSDFKTAYFYEYSNNEGKFEFNLHRGSKEIFQALGIYSASSSGGSSTSRNSASSSKSQSSQASSGGSASSSENFYFTVAGLVTDQNGKPLQGIMVGGRNNLYLTTDANGRFEIKYAHVGMEFYVWPKGELGKRREIKITRKDETETLVVKLNL